MHAVLSYAQYVLSSLCRNYSFFALSLSLHYFLLFQIFFINSFCFLYTLIENLLIYLLIFHYSQIRYIIKNGSSPKIMESFMSCLDQFSDGFHSTWSDGGDFIGGPKLLRNVCVCLWTCIYVNVYVYVYIYTYTYFILLGRIFYLLAI